MWCKLCLHDAPPSGHAKHLVRTTFGYDACLPSLNYSLVVQTCSTNMQNIMPSKRQKSALDLQAISTKSRHLQQIIFFEPGLVYSGERHKVSKDFSLFLLQAGMNCHDRLLKEAAMIFQECPTSSITAYTKHMCR